MGLLFDFACPFCHTDLPGRGPGGNVAPPPPCPHCGVYWGAGDIRYIQVGPAGAHFSPEDARVLACLLERGEGGLGHAAGRGPEVL